MFAGAAREAVFSRPDVIRRINAEFVPVALKAALVNKPGNDVEGRLYREIGRSRPAPQGICVVNPAGKVLDWALMFDDDRSVLAFLDHALKQFAKYPDAKQAVPAERFMKFPSAKLDDIEDHGRVLPIGEIHPAGHGCPAQPIPGEGTLVVRLFGRAFGEDGKPLPDETRQEHYVEDRFDIPVALQEALARGVTGARGDRFRLAGDLARLLVSHAYLGQLDVNPLRQDHDGLKQSELWAEEVGGGGSGPLRLRIEGMSAAAGASHPGEGGDGRLWEHDIELSWEGLIELQGSRIERLLLLARGSEMLRWANRTRSLKQGAKSEPDVAHLPAGRLIDLKCAVRYGMIGEAVPREEAAPSARSRQF